jgi:hypothetical protein
MIIDIYAGLVFGGVIGFVILNLIVIIENIFFPVPEWRFPRI